MLSLATSSYVFVEFQMGHVQKFSRQQFGLKHDIIEARHASSMDVVCAILRYSSFDMLAEQTTQEGRQYATVPLDANNNQKHCV